MRQRVTAVVPCVKKMPDSSWLGPGKYIPYSGYFSGDKIFVVFVVERRTTKFYSTAEYRGCGLEYHDQNVSTNY